MIFLYAIRKMKPVKNSHLPLCTISTALGKTWTVYARFTIVTSLSAMVLILTYPKTLL